VPEGAVDLPTTSGLNVSSLPQLTYDLAELQAHLPAVVVGAELQPVVIPARPYRSREQKVANATKCLTAAIYHEARSEGSEGQRAVAQVVLNRVRHAAFPNTVCGVVYDGASRLTGCQFSFTCDGSLGKRREHAAWAEASIIAQAALEGYVHAPVGHATHYHTDQVRPYWAASLRQIAVVGDHIFYRWPGRAGRPASFSDPAPGHRGRMDLAVSKAPSRGAPETISAARTQVATEASSIREADKVEPLVAERTADVEPGFAGLFGTGELR
jgi:hypothetical protein